MFGNKKKKEAQAINLVESGALGVGTITDVKDTGMSINDMSIRVKVVYTIEPLDGSASFTGEKAEMVSRVKLPQIGARFPIFYDAADPSVFAVVASIDDDSGRALITAKFGDRFGADCSGVGMPAVAGGAAAAPDPLDQLKKLAELRDAGVLTEEEFAAKKAQLLAV